jgi:hypothetical protein
VVLPRVLPPGTYTVSAGLVDVNSEKRLHVKTRLPERRDEVDLPLSFEVVAP